MAVQQKAELLHKKFIKIRKTFEKNRNLCYDYKRRNFYIKEGTKIMGKSILICDDAAFMRMMLKDILVKEGYEVVGEAVNGADGVEKYNSLKPDLVTMDITMPEMDGIAALKAIKQCDPSAKVIMCSAMGQQAMVVESIQAGARDFIVKPFQKDRVVEAIKKHIG